VSSLDAHSGGEKKRRAQARFPYPSPVNKLAQLARKRGEGGGKKKRFMLARSKVWTLRRPHCDGDERKKKERRYNSFNFYDLAGGKKSLEEPLPSRVDVRGRARRKRGKKRRERFFTLFRDAVAAAAGRPCEPWFSEGKRGKKKRDLLSTAKGLDLCAGRRREREGRKKPDVEPSPPGWFWGKEKGRVHTQTLSSSRTSPAAPDARKKREGKEKRTTLVDRISFADDSARWEKKRKTPCTESPALQGRNKRKKKKKKKCFSSVNRLRRRRQLPKKKSAGAKQNLLGALSISGASAAGTEAGEKKEKGRGGPPFPLNIAISARREGEREERRKDRQLHVALPVSPLHPCTSVSRC